jgi:hypothetical protein
MKPNKPEKRIDTDRVVEYLNRAFANAMHKAGAKLGDKDNSKGTVLYDYQVEFCYLIDSIQRDPSYIVPKKIQEANDLIARLEQEG